MIRKPTSIAGGIRLNVGRRQFRRVAMALKVSFLSACFLVCSFSISREGASAGGLRLVKCIWRECQFAGIASFSSSLTPTFLAAIPLWATISYVSPGSRFRCVGDGEFRRTHQIDLALVPDRPPPAKYGSK